MTKWSFLLLTTLPLASPIACGGPVTGSASGSTGAANGGGSTTSSSSSSASSSASSAGGGSSSSSSSAGSSSGTGGTGGCTGSIDIVVDNGAPEHFTSLCDVGWNPTMATTPTGFSFETGSPPPGGQELYMDGCAAAAPSSEGLHIGLPAAMAPGTYTEGFVDYTDTSASKWGAFNAFTVNITKLGAVGDSIEGTFTATVTHVMNGNAAHNLSGSFHVCRIPDKILP